MASKQPYIPIYIGDILKDWGHLPNELFGAAHKLLYRMWDSKQRGKICLDFASYGMMLGVGELEAKKIIDKLTSGDEPIYDREEDGERVRLINRRMVREAAVSAIRSESGSKGAVKRAAKNQKPETFASDLLENNASKTQAKAKQIPDIDNENEFENIDENLLGSENKKVSAKKQKSELIMPFDSEAFLQHWQRWKKYKLEQFDFRYKSLVAEQAAIHDLVYLAGGSESVALEIINQSISKGWKGFFRIRAETQVIPGAAPQTKKSVFQANLEANIETKRLIQEMNEKGAFDHYEQRRAELYPNSSKSGNRITASNAGTEGIY